MKNILLLTCLLISTMGISQIVLPVDFESTTIDYTFGGFGGGELSVIPNPDASGINTSANVARMIKNGPEPFGGGFMDLATPIDFSVMNSFKMSVWTPAAGTDVLLKVESPANGAIFVEATATTTTAMAWEELTFNLPETDPTETYQRITLIFENGTVGDGSDAFTYYIDDVSQTMGTVVVTLPDLPITFDDATLDYNLGDFGENVSMLVPDPEDATNTVVQTIKTVAAQTWAGTTAGAAGLDNAIPFTASETKMSVRVWSPDANIPIRLKVESATDPTVSVETEAMTTVAMEWETLEFDFANEAMGTAAFNVESVYDKVSIFFNFDTDGATAGEKTYFWDDVEFIANLVELPDLPITFDDANLDYNLGDFGENVSMLVPDPEDATNTVVQTIKTAAAQTWAGTTAGAAGLANAIPFTASETKMSVRVWSPDANIPIRLKVENAADGTISVETEAMTTVAMAWETLEFDFANEAMGTAAFNVESVYDKVSIFFNFDTDGATAGEKTYFWDDVIFLENVVELPDLPITFESTTLDYNLGDFGGNISSIVVDPVDPSNTVVQSIKQLGSETWAGTTAGAAGLASAIPFATTETTMAVRVWSPDADTPVLLKVENSANSAISVETQTLTTVAMEWETLVFDFTNENANTPAIDFDAVYDKVSIFLNFGTTGDVAGEKTYYWDDVTFGSLTNTEFLDAAANGIKVSPNPASSEVNIEFPAALSETVKIQLLDMTGRLVQYFEIADQQARLELNNQINGMYFLRIESDQKIYVQKLMVAK